MENNNIENFQDIIGNIQCNRYVNQTDTLKLISSNFSSLSIYLIDY